MRPGIQGRRLGAVQSRILPLCNNFSDFRCGDDFFAALCRCLYSVERRRVRCDDRVLAIIGRGSRLGLAEGGIDVEVRIRTAECWNRGVLECWKTTTTSQYSKHHHSFHYSTPILLWMKD